MHRTIFESPWPSLANDDDSWAAFAKNGSSGHHGDHGGNGNPGEDIRQWSSLIGIVTAIVGNILIALALNVQRYAHIQLHKKRHRLRRRAKEALKRAQSESQPGTYGTLGGESNHNNNGHGNGHGGSAGQTAEDHLDSTGESDPLTGSFNSGGASNDYDLEEGEDEETSTYLKSPYWWLGQVLITLGEMGNFLAYGFAPASIVSPLGVVALISNCIIAPAMFHEKFRQRDFWGVVIAVGGVVTVVLSAKQEETKLGPHDVWDAITTLAFEIYLAVTIFLIIALMWASGKYGKQTILIDLGLVGLFGGYTALATKGVSSMLSSSLWRAFATPVTYALIIVLLGTAVMQIRYVNKALQRFDSTQVIPIQFVMFTLCVILGSAVLYRDFERTTVEQATKFVGGCLLTFFGVFLITSGRQQSHQDEDLLSEADGVEETIGLASQDANVPSSGHGQDMPSPISQSRRPSKASQFGYADTDKTLTPQDDVYVPSIRILGPGDLLHSPGKEAPIHSANNNPWQDVGGPSTPPGQGTRTYSIDSVSAGAAIASTPASVPATPMQDSAVPPVYATEGSVMAPRPGPSPVKAGTHHRSTTFISPSPLSSTVTAVVKDAFLRAADDSRLHTSSIRRIRSSIRAGLFFSEDDGAPNQAHPAAAPTSSENDLVRAFSASEEPAADPDQVRRRSRSMSDTLGDFFRIRRKKRKDDYSFFTSDVEDGGGSSHPRFNDGDDDDN